MKLTRQDFEKFAAVIREHAETIERWGYDSCTLGNIASDLAYVLEGSNPLFDREKFLKACGV